MKTKLYRLLDSGSWKYVGTYPNFSSLRLQEDINTLKGKGVPTRLIQALTGHIVNCDLSNKGLTEAQWADKMKKVW